MKTQDRLPAQWVSVALRNGHPKAHLRLRGVDNAPVAAMLAAVERVRDALSRLGIDDLRVEVIREDEESDNPAS